MRFLWSPPLFGRTVPSSSILVRLNYKLLSLWESSVCVCVCVSTSKRKWDWFQWEPDVALIEMCETFHRNGTILDEFSGKFIISHYYWRQHRWQQWFPNRAVYLKSCLHKLSLITLGKINLPLSLVAQRQHYFGTWQFDLITFGPSYQRKKQRNSHSVAVDGPNGACYMIRPSCCCCHMHTSLCCTWITPLPNRIVTTWSHKRSQARKKNDLLV